MRRQETKKEMVTEEKTIVIKDTITCNKCGKSEEVGQFHNMNRLSTSFGYGSNYDGERWDFDLCDGCLVTIIKELQYVPEGFMQSDWKLNHEQHQKTFEDWKETDKWENFKYLTYEELESLNGYYYTEHLNDYIKKYHKDKPLLVNPDDIELED